MKIDLLVAEIGSTTTMVHAVDGMNSPSARLLGQGSAVTTASQGDVFRGLEAALDDLAHGLGEKGVEAELRTAASSAAGGLRMTVHGLAYDMTVRAAREAALGAGAVVKMVTAGMLGARQLAALIEEEPNLILLAGGIDYGDEETAYHNAEAIAEALSKADLKIPVVYAGNAVLQGDIQTLLTRHGLPVFLCDNVYPRVDELVVEPARAAIQRIFEEHIVTAPGMDRVKDLWGRTVWPTPAAVMQSAQLFCQRVGDVVVIDVGGATTDVHSVTEGSPDIQEILAAPEPRAKRTVEGDLGVYINRARIAQLLQTPSSNLDQGEAIPRSAAERERVKTLSAAALSYGLSRHAGRLRYRYGPTGRQRSAWGKDLTAVQHMVGTGGVFAFLDPDGALLGRAVQQLDRELLLPRNAAYHVDRDYVMAAAGTLARSYPDQAWQLLKTSIFRSGLI